MAKSRKTNPKKVAFGLPKLIREQRTLSRAIRLGTEADESLRKRLRSKTEKLIQSEFVSLLEAYYGSAWPDGPGASEHFKILRGTLHAEELQRLGQLATDVLSKRVLPPWPKVVREQRNQARRISLGGHDDENLRKDIRNRTNGLNEIQAVAILSNFYSNEWPENGTAIAHIKLLRGSLAGPELRKLNSLTKG